MFLEKGGERKQYQYQTQYQSQTRASPKGTVRVPVGLTEGFLNSRRVIILMTQKQLTEPSESTDDGPTPPLMATIPLPELERQRGDQIAFLKVLQQAGGARRWLRRRCPRIAALAPSTLSEVEMETLVTGETQSFWVGIDTRLKECAGCKVGEIACEPRADYLDPGIRVTLTVGSDGAHTTTKVCSHYRDVKMERRLRSVGVDARLSRVKVTDFGEVSTEVTEIFQWFLSTGSQENRTYPKAQLVIEGKNASSYGVALMRNSMRHYQNAHYQSVNAPLLIRTAKNSMNTKERSPFLDLMTVDVLIIDSVDASLLKNKYASSEISLLYDRRAAQDLATIITSTTKVGEAFPGASVLRV